MSMSQNSLNQCPENMHFPRTSKRMQRTIFVVLSFTLIPAFLLLYFEVNSAGSDGTIIDTSYRHRKELIDDFLARKAQKKVDAMERLLEPTTPPVVIEDSNMDNAKSEDYPLGNPHWRPERVIKAEQDRDFMQRNNDYYYDYENKQNEIGKEDLHASNEIKNNDKKKSANRTQNQMESLKNVLVGQTNIEPTNKGVRRKRIKKYYKLYDVKSKAPWDFDCILMETSPAAPICPYPEKEDVFISQQLRNQGIWEPHIIKEIQNLLYSDKKFGFIDVGANIGVYTLLAAAMGYNVIAVEPYLEHVKRIHKALEKGNFTDRVIVVQNAISDRRILGVMSEDEANKGATALKSPPEPCGENGQLCPLDAVSTIYLDDIVNLVTFDKAVMKIDIEGHEHRAFKHVRNLLEKVYIPYIVMEWVVLRRYYGSEIDQSEDKTLVSEMVEFLIENGYKAFSLIDGTAQEPSMWYAWQHDVVWRHELGNFVQ